MADLVHFFSSMVTSFLGSTVEAVEALTIVLAVGTVRGWSSALVGAGAGGLVLSALALLFGSAVLGLFVDDGTLAIAVLSLLAVVLVLSTLKPGEPRSSRYAPRLGHARNAFENVLRSARRSSKESHA